MFPQARTLIMMMLSQSAHTPQVEKVWKAKKVGENAFRQMPLPLSPPLASRNSDTYSGAFTFIDLFAGIGGLRQGFTNVGGECLFTSEWNTFSQRTYRENFGYNDNLVGDIRSVDASSIPAHDVLLAGFPCQPFSIAGVSKKNALGRPHGFACATQGTLFFEVARILSDLRPKAFLLENVKNLVSHDHGRTFDVICHVLEKELKYHIHYQIIDAKYFVPQHRERIFIAGFSQECDFSFNSVRAIYQIQSLSRILHRLDGAEPFLPHDGERFFNHDVCRVQEKYTLTAHMWDYLQHYAEKHRLKGNGFGYGLVGGDDIARTLSARYFKDGSEILIRQDDGIPRRLTPRECARLMGFPDSFRIPVSDTQAYRQFGNSVVVPLITAIAKAMKPYILL